MARFLRSTSTWKLRPPVVVGPAVLQRPVKVGLGEQQRPNQFDNRRLPHSRIRPPVVVGPAVLQRPVKFTLADQRVQTLNLQRGIHSKLRPPTVVGPAVQQRPLQVNGLTSFDRQLIANIRRSVQYNLRKPTVTGAVAQTTPFAPVRLLTTKTPSRFYQAKSKLFAPTVINTAVVFPGPVTHRASTPGAFFKAKSKLQAPTVVTPFFNRPMFVKLAQIIPRRTQVQGLVRKPTVVSPAYIVRPLDVETTSTPRRYFKAVSRYLQALYLPLEDLGTDLLLPPYDWEIFYQGGTAYRGRRRQLGAYVELWGDTHLQLIQRIRVYEADRAAMAIPISHQWGEVYGPNVTNLHTNGGLETTASGWQSFTATVSRVTTEHKFGNACGKFVSPGVGLNEYIDFIVPITELGTYTLSAWVKGTVAGGSICMPPSTTSNNPARIYETLTTDWQRITNSITAVAGDTFINFYFSTNNVTVPQALTFYFDGCQVEKGTVAHGYIETDGAIASGTDLKIQLRPSREENR